MSSYNTVISFNHVSLYMKGKLISVGGVVKVLNYNTSTYTAQHPFLLKTTRFNKPL